ncbi:MAG: TetR family transcriptional regulator [Myxococcales bacterium]|nr:TetR family transcriptional regulator [Myxococcales bacterium]
MFAERGYAATTIDEICAAVPTSKRTFFRYFADKEALVFPNRRGRLARFQELLAAVRPDQSPFDVFRTVTSLFAAEYTENREQLLAQQRLIAQSPELLAREREIDSDWEREIAASFVRRMPPGESGPWLADVLAGAVMGTVRATMRHWYADDGQADLESLGLEAIDYLERGFVFSRQEPDA